MNDCRAAGCWHWCSTGKRWLICQLLCMYWNSPGFGIKRSLYCWWKIAICIPSLQKCWHWAEHQSIELNVFQSVLLNNSVATSGVKENRWMDPRGKHFHMASNVNTRIEVLLCFSPHRESHISTCVPPVVIGRIAEISAVSSLTSSNQQNMKWSLPRSKSSEATY